MMKLFFLTMFLCSWGEASTLSKRLFISKLKFEEKASLLKLESEKELMSIQKKAVSESLLSDQSCFDWVYSGPASREEAARACRGVVLVDCLTFVYSGPATRLEAAQACRGVSDMECVRKVYQGSASRIEAAQACGYGSPTPGCRLD
jgi:hypothetical protein